ncbi:MAG: phosphate acyltransferase PlsX [Alphaproteobacteria bacterium]|nr:phosphate acyltransferase PlsX [Alphaproteobacteria bacterium]
MTNQLTVALDAMGGDHAPYMVIKGASIAQKRFPKIHYIIVGDQHQIEPLIDALPELKAASTLIHSDQQVKADDKPAVALRSGRQSSMRLALDTVHEGRAQGAVSAGNTGALMAIAKFVLKTLPGIDRPAIASFFPTMRGETVMLDLGANIQCDSDNLVQFAIMGNVFAKTVLGVLKPSIGLLNVGSEDMKGNEIIRQAHNILKEINIPGRYHGFIEGDDITKGTVNVVVTDGFSGNIALKTIEGTAKLYTEFLRNTFKSSFLAQLGYLLSRPALNSLKIRLDPRRYNGAIFLGLKGVVIKSHGGTDALGFANAIGVAVDMITQKSIEKIQDNFSTISSTLLNQSS